MRTALWVLSAIGGLLAVLWGTREAQAQGLLDSASITREEARSRFGQKVARQWKHAVRAEAEHGIPASILLAIMEQESSGRTDLRFHPDGVSWGLMGLTEDGALASVAPNETLSADSESITPARQVDIAAKFLAKLKGREGSLWEAVKWYNSGVRGGGDYAAGIFEAAGRPRPGSGKGSTGMLASGGGGPSTAVQPKDESKPTDPKSVSSKPQPRVGDGVFRPFLGGPPLDSVQRVL